MKMATKHPRIAGLIIDSGVASVSSVWGKFIANKGIDVAAVDQCERELVGQQVVMTNYKGMLYFFIRFSLFSQAQVSFYTQKMISWCLLHKMATNFTNGLTVLVMIPLFKLSILEATTIFMMQTGSCTATLSKRFL